VWGTSSHDVFAVGDTIILHYNGSAWTTMTTGTNYSLRSAWGSSSSDVFVVGYGDYSGNGGYGAIILHYNGSAWTTMTSGTTNPLYGVWGSSATKVFAVGDGGTILRFDGAGWSSMSSGTANRLSGVWGASATNVFAVGNNGTILRYDGSSWNPMTSGTTEWLRGVWGSSSTDVFAVSGRGILHYDGSSWTSMYSGTTSTLHGVWGSSPTDVFAVGGFQGTILHYSGPPPNVGSVSPSTSVQGQMLSSVVITGTYFTGATNVSFGSGVTVNNFVVDSSTQITASITVTGSASIGARDVSVTTPAGIGTSADIFSVAYDGLPHQPLNVSPANGACTAGLTPMLQSSAFSDPDAGDTHAASQWQITTTADNYSSPVFDSGTDASNLTSIAAPPSLLNYHTTYYWHVRQQDDHGAWSDWSAETSFTVGHPPNQPSNIVPPTATTGVSLTPTLQSSPFVDPDSGDNHAASQWQVRKTSGSYSSPIYDSGMDNANLTIITIPSGLLSHSTACCWHVRYQDSTGLWSDWSAETFFTTIAKGGLPFWIWIVVGVAAVLIMGAIAYLVGKGRVAQQQAAQHVSSSRSLSQSSTSHPVTPIEEQKEPTQPPPSLPSQSISSRNERGWFTRHLSLTLFLAWLVANVLVYLGLFFMPEDGSLQIGWLTLFVIAAIVMIGTEVWYLKRKRRSLAFLLLNLLSYIGLIILLTLNKAGSQETQGNTADSKDG
jgi:hypothetical protein